MKITSVKQLIPAPKQGDAAVTYEIDNRGSYFRYDPNTGAVHVSVSGYLYKVVGGTKRTPCAGYGVYIDDDKGIISEAGLDDTPTTDADGHFYFSCFWHPDDEDSDQVENLCDSNTIIANALDTVSGTTVATLTIQRSDVGGNGTNGSYIYSTFNLSKQDTSSSSEIAPSDLCYAEWLDAPVKTNSTYPYLWCCQKKYDGVNSIPVWVRYFRVTGDEGPKGEDSVTFRIEAEPAVITRNPNTGLYSHDKVTITVVKTVGKTTTILRTGKELADAGVDVLYEYASGGTDYLSNYDTSDMIVTLSDFFSIKDHKLRLVDWEDEKIVHHTFQLTVLRHGADGTAGKAGKFYYYAGKFDEEEEYTSSEKQAPFVDFDWLDEQTVNGETVTVSRTSYYMLVADTNLVNGVYIAPRTTDASGIWELMESDMKFLITEAIFTTFAKLGSAVFSGDWMISQHGFPGRVLSADSRTAIEIVTNEDYRYKIVLREATDELPEISEERGPFTINDIAVWDMYHYENVDGVDVSFPNMPDVVAIFLMEQLGISDDQKFLDFVNNILIPDAVWAVSCNLAAAQLLELGTETYQYFGWVTQTSDVAWTPNLAIDLRTGEIKSYNINILGVLKAPIVYHPFKDLQLEIRQSYNITLNDEIVKIFCLGTTLADTEASNYVEDANTPVVYIPAPTECTGKVFEFIANGGELDSEEAGFHVRTVGWNSADQDQGGFFNKYLPYRKDNASFRGYLRIVSDGTDWIVLSHVC